MCLKRKGDSRFRVIESHSLRHITKNKRVIRIYKTHSQGPLFVFGMSDMQFCKPSCVPLRLKPTDWELVFEHPHLNYGYAVTSHSSQGQTADRVLLFFSFPVVYLYYVPCPEILFVSPSMNAYDRRL